MHIESIVLRALVVVALLLALPAAADPRPGLGETYARLVHASYRDAHAGAVHLREAIAALLSDPGEPALARAKAAWQAAREPYGLTEAFRFYEGPIDAERGPEGRINAWPLDESFIDYVAGHPGAGLVQQAEPPITREALVERNAAQDEAQVTTGYHAIEFLLWGQDLAADGPGRRPATDYSPGTPAADRRRAYLRVVADLLVDDLAALVGAWAPGPETYRARFLAWPAAEQRHKILTGVATLSGFELASERIGVPLDSRDQENEQSCFSDTTHVDLRANVRGIWNVCCGHYAEVAGTGLLAELRSVDAALAERLEAQLRETLALAEALPAPIDRALAEPAGGPGRAQLERLSAALLRQSELLVAAGKAFGLTVVVAGE